jgi:PKD repeat protein
MRGRPASIAAATLLLCAGGVRAASIVPARNLGELARESTAVVLARPLDSETVTRGGLPFTSIRFSVERVVAGTPAAGDVIVTLVPGGMRDGSGWLVPGSPRFALGKSYLLFLDRAADATWRPRLLAYGVLEEATAADGSALLEPLPEARDLRALPAPDGALPEPIATYHEGALLDHLRDVVTGKTEWNGSAVEAAPAPDSFTAGAQSAPSGCAFMRYPDPTTGTPMRWDVFDSGGSIDIAAAGGGDSELPDGGFSEVQGALGDWMNVPATSLRLGYSGTLDYTLSCTSGQDMPPSGTRVVIFNDPCSDIADLNSCSGVLAFGGPWFSGTHSFDGTTWYTIRSWFAIVNNGVGSCLSPQSYQLMLTHELGHGLGFGHVSDPTAAMYPYCCNAIDQTDVSCAQYLYPVAASLPSQPSGVTASDGAFPDRVRVAWSPSPSASSYELWRGTSEVSASATLLDTTSATTLDDTSAAAGTTYWYWVRAKNDQGVSPFSIPDSGFVQVCGATATPVADFDWSPQGVVVVGGVEQQQPFVNQTVQFHDRSSNAPTSWSWSDFQETPAAHYAVANPTHKFASAGTKTVRLQAANCAGNSPEIAKGVTVYPDVRPVVPAFTVGSDPRVGDKVDFTARSGLEYGDPDTFTWDFGDGTSLVTGQPSVEHVYPCARSYEVRLSAGRTLQGGTASSSVPYSAAVEVAGSPACEPDANMVIPAAAHTGGENSTLWRSDVDFLNLLGQPGGAQVSLFRRDRDNSDAQTKSFAVPPGPFRSLRLTDVLGSEFSADNAALGVQVTSGALRVGSRFYTTSACGTYGMYIPAAGDGEALEPGQTGVLFPLSYSRDSTRGYRTNIGFANATDADVDVVVTLFGDDGGVLGRVPYTLRPFEHHQFTRIHAAVDSPDVAAGYATVEVKTPGGIVHAYAMLIDNVSGDPTFITARPTGVPLAQACASPATLVVPAAAHTAGENGSLWRSDLDFVNLSQQPAQVVLALLLAGQANPQPETRTVTIPAARAVRLPDVLGSLFSASNAALRISLCSDAVQASSRFYNTASPCGGTYGMAVPAAPDAYALHQGQVGVFHLLAYSPDRSHGYRTNVGFANGSGFDVDVRVSLFGDAGELLGSKVYTLRPYEHRQLTRIHATEFAIDHEITDGSATVEILTPLGAVHVYAMVIDNRSGDPMFLPADLE